MVKKKIIIVSMIIGMLIIIVGGVLYFKNKAVDNNSGNIEDSIINTSRTLNENQKEKILLTVNGEEIKQLDINYQKLINENLNKNHNNNDLATDYEGIKDEIIKRKILLQEARKNNVDIDETEKNIIEKSYTEAITETDKQIAQEIGMTTDEFLKYTIEKQIESRVAEKMREKIIMEILKGEINLNDEELNNKIQGLKDNLNYGALQEIYNSYMGYLIENSNINYTQ